MIEAIFITSSVFIICAFGAHAQFKTLPVMEQPPYIRNPFIEVFVTTSPYVFPLISWILIIDLHWAILLLINTAFILILASPFTSLIRFFIKFSKDFVMDAFIKLILGLILFFVGLIVYFSMN